MTGVRLKLSIGGADDALNAVKAASERAAEPRLMWENIGMSLVVSTQRRFETETDPEGSPWPPSIRALAHGGRTLTDSARMKNSITYEAGDSGVAVGTNAIYAAPHQFGMVIRAVNAPHLVFKIGGGFVSKKEVTIPRRAFLGLDEADEREIEAIALDFVNPERGGARP